jgi:hypothetical protein
MSHIKLKRIEFLLIILAIAGLIMIYSCQPTPKDEEINERVYNPGDFPLLKGVEMHYSAQFSSNHFLRLVPGEKTGWVSRYYFGPSVRHTVSLSGKHGRIRRYECKVADRRQRKRFIFIFPCNQRTGKA